MFLLGSESASATVVLLAAESSTVIQNALDELKRYVYPYYQEDSDEVILAEYLGRYCYVNLAAAKMWYELPGRMIAGNVQSYGTGSETTQFVGLNEAQQFCFFQGKHFETRHNEEIGNDTGQAVKLSGGTIAGGAMQ